MIWHIFKKDFRLLWPFVAGLALLRAIDTGMAFKMGLFSETAALDQVRTLLESVLGAATALLIVVVIHQDGIAGNNQDWLARPFQRRNVLIAKVLFVLTTINGPQMLLSLGLALAQQRSPGEAFGITFAGGAVSIARSLSVIIVAALSRTVLEGLVGVLLLAAVISQSFLIGSIFGNSLIGFSTLWVSLALLLILAGIGATIILPSQYNHRNTLLLRSVFVGGAFVYFVALPSLPWNARFGLQTRLSPNPNYAAGMTIAFDPRLDRFRSSAGVAKPQSGLFYLPIRVSGLPQGSALDTDHQEITVTGMNGNVLYHRSALNFFSATKHDRDGEVSLWLRLPDTAHGRASIHQAFPVPQDIYDRIKDQPVRVRVDYAMTLLARRATLTLAADSGRTVIPGLGSCAAMHRALTVGNQLGIWCFQSAAAPTCFTETLHNRRTGARNPEATYCMREYNPRAARLALLDNKPGEQVLPYPFYSELDPDTPVYPVQFDQIADSDLVVTPYVPQVWFTRSVETPPIRLRDFTAVTAPARTVTTNTTGKQPA